MPLTGLKWAEMVLNKSCLSLVQKYLKRCSRDQAALLLPVPLNRKGIANFKKKTTTNNLLFTVVHTELKPVEFIDKVTAAVEQIIALAPSRPHTNTTSHSLTTSHIYIINYMALILFTLILASDIQAFCVFVRVIN